MRGIENQARNIRKALLCGGFILYATGIIAQPTTWIDFSQPYYKLRTAQDGIYRINYQALTEAGFPTDQISTDNLQLFHRGMEQAILVVDGGDNQLNQGDYIEFYGLRNDGTLDGKLYSPSDAQPHSYHNLYSDTTTFFLTWKPGMQGKRMRRLSLNPGGAAHDYQWSEQLFLMTSNYSAGRRYPVGGSGATYRSQFDYGEGFTGQRIRNGDFLEFELNEIVNSYTSGPSPELEILLAGRNEALHQVEFLVGTDGNMRSLGTADFQYFDNYLFTANLNWSDLPTAANAKIRVSVTNSDPDQVSVSYIKLRYPETPNYPGNSPKFLEIEPATQNRPFLLQATSSTQIYDVTDPSNVSIIETIGSNGSLSMVIPANTANRKLLAQESALNPGSLQRSYFRALNPNEHDFLIISHSSLHKPVGNYIDPVQAYAAYRASSSGGGYDTLSVDMELLYDQFNYGEVSPLAIRHFVEYMLPGDPKYLLLIGKGYNVNFKPYRQDPLVATTFDLVPTVGFPGSDIALTAGLGNSGFGAALPTGRVNARNPAEVASYLDKLIEMESTQFNALWRKRIIHLSGGLTQGELVLFKRYVDQFKAVAEGPFMGANVTTVNKQTNEATVLIDIAEEVNKGVSLITFFGHSSTQVTDIEIGKVTDVTLGYNNDGRYPMILVNGCNAGNIFFTSTGFGEDWILAPNKGAIGYLAHTDAGFAGNLKRYSDIFYELAYSDSVFINKPIGNIIQELGRRYLTGGTTDEAQIAQVQQEVFQGDPAFSFFPVDKPDYETNNENVFLQPFEGESINAQVDSFQVGIITRNFGRTSPDSLNVTVRRTFGDGQIFTYDSVFFAPVNYVDTLYFTVKNDQFESFGNNKFEVLLDYNQSIDELDEANNSGTVDFFIPQGGTINLSPYPFAIVNQPQLVLIAQASDLLSGNREFILEMDTASNFGSPFRQLQTASGDGVVSWEVQLLPEDSVVYYWRSRFQDPRAGEDTTWTLSSFIFIEDSPAGWSQARFAQFDQNKTDLGLSRNAQSRSWEFSTTENRIEITTYGPDHPESEPANISVIIDGQPVIVSTRLCPDNSLNAIAFDQASTVPYAVLTTGGFDVLDRNRCGRTPQSINTFRNSDITNELKLDEYLEKLGEGDYAVLFSIGSLDYSQWGTSTREKLTQIGISNDQLGGLQSGEPVIIVGKNGSLPGTALIIRGDESSPTPLAEQAISISHILTGRFQEGVLFSPRIGPASSWGSLHQVVTKDSNDETKLDLIGITGEGIERNLRTDIRASSLVINDIDVNTYPFLRLKFTISDPVSLTPAQMKRWQVIYESVPEGVLLFRGNDANSTSKIPLREGQQFTSEFTFFNVSSLTYPDSLLVRSTTFNREMRSTFTNEMKIGAVAPKDSAAFSLTIDSKDLAGINDYRVFVNPNLLPERTYTNNINDFQQYLEVKPDDTHPILDVTFDGIHILDGDIVAPSPLIGILLKDDNQFDLKQDTVGMEIFIKSNGPDCGSCEFRRVNFSDPRLRWSPATDKEDFRIEYQPDPLADGIYTLQVQGQDNSGRKSGTEPYTINFEVINESTITNFYPYPNPFSTSTRFVFTLTGAEIPDEMKIQIMTVTGKIVREIMRDELGIIRIGNNITDYAWDGKDEYGDQLANGVYIYRVVLGGVSDLYKHRETSADKAFKKGYGKLYLLR